MNSNGQPEDQPPRTASEPSVAQRDDERHLPVTLELRGARLVACVGNDARVLAEWTDLEPFVEGLS